MYLARAAWLGDTSDHLDIWHWRRCTGNYNTGFRCTPLFVLPPKVFFKLAERRIDRDAGGKNVDFGFDVHGRECSVPVVVDVIDRSSEHFVFQIVKDLGWRFRVRAPFDFQDEVMRSKSSLVAFVSDALVDQSFHALDQF